MKQKNAPPLSIVYQRIDQLKPFANNARTHSRAQIRQIARSIRAFGFHQPRSWLTGITASSPAMVGLKPPGLQE